MEHLHGPNDSVVMGRNERTFDGMIGRWGARRTEPRVYGHHVHRLHSLRAHRFASQRRAEQPLCGRCRGRHSHRHAHYARLAANSEHQHVHMGWRQTYCAGRGAGWRVPALKELLTLIDPTRISPAVARHLPNLPHHKHRPSRSRRVGASALDLFIARAACSCSCTRALLLRFTRCSAAAHPSRHGGAVPHVPRAC